MKKSTGFTLIEMMVTVAIVAVLASIAYPSYRKQIQRSNRAEARVALMQIQVAQEKFFLQHNRYADTSEMSPAPTATPPGLGIAAITPAGHYDIVLRRPTTTTYEAEATPRGPQADDASCALFRVNQTGTRYPATTSGCWK